MQPVMFPNPIEIVLLFLLGGGFGLPSSVPPLPEDPMMAKVAPADCLVYATWAGAKLPDAQSGNQTEQLLAEPEVQEFLKRSQLALRQAGVQAIQGDGDLSAVIDLMQGRAGAFFLTDVRVDRTIGFDLTGGLVLQAGEDADILRKQIAMLLGRAPRNRITPIEVAGQKFERVLIQENGPAIDLGVHEGYFIVGFGEGSAEGILRRAQGEPPGWLKELRAKLPVPRMRSLSSMNISRIMQTILLHLNEPEWTHVMLVSGLNGIDSFSSVSGLDERGCVTRSRLTIQQPARGLLSWIDAKPLTADDLKLIDRDSPAALAFTLDASKALDLWLDLMGKLNPREAQGMEQALASVRTTFGIDIREDLLKGLGSTWKVFAQPGPNGLITGWAAAIGLRDRERLVRTEKPLIMAAAAILSQRGGLEFFSFVPTETAGFTMYSLNFGGPVAPSWCITKDELLITVEPETLKALLARKKDDASLAELPDVKALFDEKSRPFACAYIDSKRVAETLLPLAQQALKQGALPMNLDMSGLPAAETILPHLTPIRMALRPTADGVELVSHHTLPGQSMVPLMALASASLAPAGMQAQVAAMRAASTNNLKQIGLALHNYHDAFQAFPAGYNAADDETPLLSWRVHILPFLDEAPLYNQFHLDEPWDSPHNKALIPRMPAVLRSPKSVAEPGMTNYLGMSGADGIFIRPEAGNRLGTNIRDITDGTSSTMMTVEVPDDDAVIWTKPGDFAPDEKEPIKGLPGLYDGGFMALFGDGSVRFISQNIDADMLKGFFTKAGGEQPPMRF